MELGPVLFQDIAIGFLAANSLVHMAIGITGSRFLSPFGYGKSPNIIYSFLCLVGAAILLGLKDTNLLTHPIVIGVAMNYVAALFAGSVLYNKWNKS